MISETVELEDGGPAPLVDGAPAPMGDGGPAPLEDGAPAPLEDGGPAPLAPVLGGGAAPGNKWAGGGLNFGGGALAVCSAAGILFGPGRTVNFTAQSQGGQHNA